MLARLRPGRVLAVILVAAFFGLLAYGLVAKADSNVIDESLLRGRAASAPALDLPVLSPGRGAPPAVERAMADGRLSIAELRGTPVVLNLWASWCPPCRDEQPLLQGAWRGARERGGPLFLGLDQQDLSGDARAYLREFGVDYPVVRDPEDATARLYGATGLPETFFIDARGLVVGHVIGAVSREQLADGAEAARRGEILGARAGGERREAR